jgi:hypothetical protein
LSAAPAGADPGTPAPAWLEERLPAGSAYSWEQWEEAREGGANIVLEVHNVVGESTLVAWPRTKETSAFETLLFEGCLLLAPRSPHAYPDAICGELKLKNVQFPWTYRVVRPQSHRKDLFFMFGARGTADFNPTQATLRATAVQETFAAAPPDEHESGREPRERQRAG